MFTRRNPVFGCSCSVQSGMTALPAAGEQIDVLVRRRIELWQGAKRVQFAAGSVYSGSVVAIDADGLLDLATDDGQVLRFYAREKALEITANLSADTQASPAPTGHHASSGAL